MPVIIPDGYCQVTINYRGPLFASGGAATVLGFGLADFSGTVQDVADEIASAVNEFLVPVISNQVTISEIVVVTEEQRGVSGLNVTGGVDAETCVPNSAVLASYSTDRRGPRGRGRSYWPGMAFESSTNGFGVMTGLQTAGLQDAIQDFFFAVLTSLGGASQQVILQHTSDDPARPDKTPPISPPPQVTNIVVSSRLATQRRRLRR